MSVGQESLDQFKSWFDLGDFIQAAGSLMRSRTGEVTLLVSAFKMLSKAISPLPAAQGRRSRWADHPACHAQ